ncbi:MFS transporter [Carnobacterium antarcticum]|uniref:MFS transporter n=1 Tax=Carnobacterium antarcticum TaxID=2126436 RepID=A0ABW4NQU5_9LACT|nr:MFS transporter [Carnobacterium sp. CP1]ALV22912.1 multidrug resistance protein [Carnobacterium sp. CP1]
MKTAKLVMDKEFIFLLLALMLVEYVRAAYVISYLPVQAAVSNQFSVAFVGLAVSLHFISDAFSNFQIGFLMNRFGVKKVVSLSFILCTLALISVPLLQFNSFSILMAAIVLGFGACPIWIIVLARASNGARGSNMGLVYFCWLVGIAGGVILMNYLMDIHLLFAYWLLPVLLLIGFIFFKFSGEHPSPNKENQSFKEVLLQAAVVLKRSRNILPGTLMQSIAVGMMIPILPTFALQDLQFKYSQYTLLIVSAGLTAAVFMIPLGRLTDHFKTKGMFISGFALFGAGLILLTTTLSLNLVFLTVIALALAYTTYLPSWNAYVASSIHHEDQNVSWGIISSFQGVGTMLGPIIGGLIATLGSGVTILISGLLFIVMALFYFVLK